VCKFYQPFFFVIESSGVHNCTQSPQAIHNRKSHVAAISEQIWISHMQICALPSDNIVFRTDSTSHARHCSYVQSKYRMVSVDKKDAQTSLHSNRLYQSNKKIHYHLSYPPTNAHNQILTFKWPYFVINSCNKTNEMH